MKDWRAVLVKLDSTIEEAITVIDKSALRIALVVDSNSKLLGTLTDGDVRRAMLNHVALTMPVEDVMCSTPKISHPGWSRERVLSVMEANSLLHLPVVDESGTVVGLQTLNSFLDKPRYSTPVFLMAGGFGTRLFPLTQDCPKPLLKVGDKAILELILERLISAGFHNFYISTHYLPELIHQHFGDGSDWGVSIRYTHEDVPLGTGGALGLLPREEINEPIILMNGDLLTKTNFPELLAFHNQHQSIATMAVRTYEHQVPYGVVEHDGHLLQKMVEKPVQRFFVNAGIYVLEPELVFSVRAGEKIDMPNLLENWMTKGRTVNTFPLNEYWLDIGQIEDFNRAQVEVRDMHF